MLVLYLALLEDAEDEEKFIKLYKKYVDLARWVAYQRVHDTEIAEECVQETFFSIARNFHKVGDIDAPETKQYVCVIAQGFAIKAYHKEHKAVFVDFESEDELDSMVDPTANSQPNEFDATELADAMDKILDDEEKELMYLKFSYKYRYKELAKYFNTTEYFVKKKVASAVQKLMKYYKEERNL